MHQTDNYPTNMKLLVRLILLLVPFVTLPAADVPKPAPPEKDWPEPAQVIRLWPGKPPGQVTPSKPEGIVNQRIQFVSDPELWVYPPGKAGRHRAALIICPGGGYMHLAMGLHVGNVLGMMHARDIVVFALKYRTKYGSNDVAADAAADCARAVRLVRQRADEWGIDSGRVGVQGYSAGSNVCLNLLVRNPDGDPAAADPVDRISGRPDFAVMMCLWPNGKPAAAYPIYQNPPPVFMASARDDAIAPTTFVLEIAEAMKKQGGAVETFLVPNGGHGAFHYGKALGPGAQWPDAFFAWLAKTKIGMPAK
jgi:endo-1,4-beta-xylanase